MLGEDVGSRADFCSMQNLHSRHPWRSSCRQAPRDGFTAFLDRHTPHPKIGETAQTGNYCFNTISGFYIAEYFFKFAL